MKHNYRSLILLATIMLSLFNAEAYRQIKVTGNIYDMRTADHLPGTKIEMLTQDSTVAASTTAYKETFELITANSGRSVESGEFSVEVSDSIEKYILVATHDGFEPYSEVVNLADIGKRQYEIKLKPIYLTPESKTIELDEFVINATKVKFYNKGDTIVYNADAFILPEGSMLDALIAQLPGVEFKDGGKIYVNGKYVESLLLNGEDFFKGNKDVLLQNIGAYTVKNVEVYDKYNEMSRLMGRKIDGDSEYVMDVKLKKDYMGGFMGNAELGYGTKNRYLGRLFGMHFNTNARFAAYLNLNNLNNTHRPTEGGGYGYDDNYSRGVYKITNGGFDYLVSDLRKVWKTSGNIDVNYIDHNLKTDKIEENFLTGGNTYQSSFAFNRRYDLNLSTTHLFTWEKPLFYVRIDPSFKYNRHYASDGSVSAMFDSNVQENMDVTTEVLNAIYSPSSPKELREALVNRNKVEAKQKGNDLSAHVFNQNTFKFKNSPDALSVWFETDYKRTHNDTHQLQTIDYGNYPAGGPLSSQSLKSRLYGYPAYDFMIKGSSRYYINSKDFTYSFCYEFRHEQQQRTAERMMLEARAEHEEAVIPELETLLPDYANSNQSKQFSNIHQLKGKAEYTKKYENGLEMMTSASVEYHITGRHLNYNGYAQENEGGGFMPVYIPISKTTGGLRDSYIKFFLFHREKGNLNFSYTVNTILPSLLEMVDLPNTSDPLNISMGNPDLKKATRQSINLYLRLLTRKNSHVTFIVDGNYISNDNTRGYRYDSATGVRIFRTYNTSGNWNLSPRAEYYLSFGPHEQLSLNTRIQYQHSRFANMIGENAEPTKQIVLQDRYLAGATLDWRTKRFALRGGGSINEIFTNTVSGNIHISYINPYANFWVKITENLGFGTDYNVYLKSGMADRNMNTTRHLLNANLYYQLNDSWSFSLKAYDILGSVNNVEYMIDSRGRTETINNNLPRYFLFSVGYKFNTKKNK